MDQIQVYRCVERRRPNQAWWNAKLQEDGWHVHFHADFVPSTDWQAVDTAELFARLEAEHDAWVAVIDQKQPQREEPT